MEIWCWDFFFCPYNILLFTVIILVRTTLGPFISVSMTFSNFFTSIPSFLEIYSCPCKVQFLISVCAALLFEWQFLYNFCSIGFISFISVHVTSNDASLWYFTVCTIYACAKGAHNKYSNLFSYHFVLRILDGWLAYIFIIFCQETTLL